MWTVDICNGDSYLRYQFKSYYEAFTCLIDHLNEDVISAFIIQV